MLLGHNLRLELVYLIFLVGKCFAAPPLTARSIKYIKEDKNPTEDQQIIYPASQYQPMPVITDVTYSERSAAKALSTNSSTVSIWKDDPHVYSPSLNKHAFRSVHSYPAPPLRSGNQINVVSFTSNYKPHRVSPFDTGRNEGPEYSSQDQHNGRNPLRHSQTDGDQHGGKTPDLSKSSIRINEKSSIVRGIRRHIKLAQNLSPAELKPVLNSPSEEVMDVSSTFVPLPHLQMSRRPFIQGAQSISFRSKQEEQSSSERDTAQRADKTAYVKPENFIRVKTSHASKDYRPFVTTVTKDQDQVQDRRGEPSPLATYLSTSNSMTSKGLFSFPHFSSAGSDGIQSQKTQREPSGTMYATSAPQLAWRYQYRSKGEGGEAKSFDSPPGTLSPSNYSSQPNVRTLGGLQSIQTVQRPGAVQWLVVKPNLASNSARETVNHRGHLSYGVHSSTATKQSVYQHIQNLPHFTSSTSVHTARESKLTSQSQTPQVTELRSDAQVIPSIVPSVPHYTTSGRGYIHRATPSEVRPFQLAPIIRSHKLPTSVGYQPSESVYLSMRDFRGWTPTALPAPAGSGIQQATVPLTEGTFGKQLHAHSNPPQYNPIAPAKSNLKNSEDHYYQPRTLHDQQVLEYGEPKDKKAFSEYQPGQGQFESSHGWTTNASAQSTDVSPISRPVGGVFSNISQTIAADAGKPPSQDLSADLQDGTKYVFNESTLMSGKENTPPSRNTTGSDQAAVGLRNHSSQFGSIESHQNSAKSNIFTSDTTQQYSRPVPTQIFSPRMSPEVVLTIKGVYTSDGDIHSTSQNGTLSHSFKPQNDTQDKSSISFPDSIPTESVTSLNGIRNIQAKIINIQPATKEVLNSSQDDVKSAKEHRIDNDEQAEIIQKYMSHVNATQSSRPTSSVVVGKRIKAYPKDKRTELETQKSPKNSPSQPTIYRSPIIRSKSKSKTSANGSVDPVKHNTTSENHGKLNQDIGIEAQTGTSPANVEMEPSYVNLTVILRSTDIPAQNTGATQHVSSPPRRLNQNLKSLQFLDVAGSASFSMHEPVLKETHSRDDVQPANSSDTEATHPIGDGWRQNATDPTPTNLHSLS